MENINEESSAFDLADSLIVKTSFEGIRSISHWFVDIDFDKDIIVQRFVLFCKKLTHYIYA